MERLDFTSESSAWFDFAFGALPYEYDHEIMISRSPLDDYFEITYKSRVQSVVYLEFGKAWKAIKKYNWLKQ